MFKVTLVACLCVALLGCSVHRLPRVRCDGKLEPINAPLVEPKEIEPDQDIEDVRP